MQSLRGGRYFIEVNDSELTQELGKIGISATRVEISNNKEEILSHLTNTTGNAYYVTTVKEIIPGADSITRSHTRPKNLRNSTIYKELTDEEIARDLNVPVTGTTRDLLVKKYTKKVKARVVPEHQLSLQPFQPGSTDESPLFQIERTGGVPGLVSVPNLINGMNQGLAPSTQGIQPLGAQPSGMKSTRTQPSGMKSTGTQPSGMKSTGTQPLGMKSIGTQPSGLKSTGTQPSGMKSTGTQSSGMKSTGTQPSGMKSAVTQPSGMKSTGTQPSGMKSTGTQPSRMKSTGTQQSQLKSTGMQPLGSESTALSHPRNASSILGSSLNTGRSNQMVSPACSLITRSSDGESLPSNMGPSPNNNGLPGKMVSPAYDMLPQSSRVGPPQSSTAPRRDNVKQSSVDGGRQNSSTTSNIPMDRFLTLSVSGNHRSSDVCFVFSSGDVLYASRGYLTAVCPAMEPFLYTTEDLFSISVVTMTRTSYSIQIGRNEVIMTLKWKIHLVSGIPVDQQRLVYNGEEIHDYATTSSCGIGPSSEVHIVYKKVSPTERRSVRLCGGGAKAAVSVGIFRLESSVCVYPLQKSVPQRLETQSIGSDSITAQPLDVDLPSNIHHIVICEEISACVMESIINYLYTGFNRVDADCAVQLAVVAEMLHISAIGEEALRVVRTTLNQDNLLLPLVMSFKNHAVQLQSVCLPFLEDKGVLQNILEQIKEDQELVSRLRQAVSVMESLPF